MTKAVCLLLFTLLVNSLAACNKDKPEPSVDPDGEKQYKNPVVAYSLPDPTVIKAPDGYFYLFATEDTRNVPIHRSKNLTDWNFTGTAFTDQTRPSFEPEEGWILLFLCFHRELL